MNGPINLVTPSQNNQNNYQNINENNENKDSQSSKDKRYKNSFSRGVNIPGFNAIHILEANIS